MRRELARIDSDIEAMRQAIAKRLNNEAHETEDGILEYALRKIAEGDENPAELAEAALRATNINYDRWYE